MNFIQANEGDRVQTNDFKDIGTVVDVTYLENGNGDMARRYVKVRGGWFLNDELFGSDITVLYVTEKEDHRAVKRRPRCKFCGAARKLDRHGLCETGCGAK